MRQVSCLVRRGLGEKAERTSLAAYPALTLQGRYFLHRILHAPLPKMRFYVRQLCGTSEYANSIPPFFATVPFSYNTTRPDSLRIWVIDWALRQGYNVCVIMAPCKRWYPVTKETPGWLAVSHSAMSDPGPSRAQGVHPPLTGAPRFPRLALTREEPRWIHLRRFCCYSSPDFMKKCSRVVGNP